LLITGGLMLAVFTITETPARGWLSVFTIGLGALSVLMVGIFVVRESRIAQPLLPMTIFADRRVWVANLAQFLAVGALFAFQFLLALYLQDVLGYGPAATGVAFLPITAMIGIFSLVVAPRVIVRWGGRAVLITGLTLIGIGLALLARVPVDGPHWLNIFPVTMIMGAGGGLTLPALAGLGMAAATDDDSGVASGLLNTTQQVGGALGLAVLSSLAAARTAVELAGGASADAALTAGYRLAFGVGAGLIVVAIAITAVALRKPGQSTPPAPASPKPQVQPGGATSRATRSSRANGPTVSCDEAVGCY
jgi:MFS family permease